MPVWWHTSCFLSNSMDHCLAYPLETDPFSWLPRIRGFPRLYFLLKIQHTCTLTACYQGLLVELSSSYLSSQNKPLPLPLICPRTFLLSNFFFYKNSSAHACGFVAVFTQCTECMWRFSYNRTYFFFFPTGRWLWKRVVIDQRSVWIGWPSSSTALRATGSNWLITLKGTHCTLQ